MLVYKVLRTGGVCDLILLYSSYFLRFCSAGFPLLYFECLSEWGNTVRTCPVSPPLISAVFFPGRQREGCCHSVGGWLSAPSCSISRSVGSPASPALSEAVSLTRRCSHPAADGWTRGRWYRLISPCKPLLWASHQILPNLPRASFPNHSNPQQWTNKGRRSKAPRWAEVISHLFILYVFHSWGCVHKALEQAGLSLLHLLKHIWTYI